MVYISIDEILKNGIENFLFFDVRWELQGQDGFSKYLDGHIKNAIFFDLDKDLSDLPSSLGRHPLPNREKFIAFIEKIVSDKKQKIVVYDEQNKSSGRLWWMLKNIGYENTYILDGGYFAYQKQGLEIEKGGRRLESFEKEKDILNYWQNTVDFEKVDKNNYMLIDARDENRYLGLFEPVDKYAGHIKDAKNIPVSKYYKDAYLIDNDLKENDIVVYCGSGVTACQLISILENNGCKNLLLYPGSWSEWSNKKNK